MFGTCDTLVGMPNWCETDLVFKGPERAMNVFLETLMASPIEGEEELVSLLNTFLPRPEIFHEVEQMPRWRDAELAEASSDEVRLRMQAENAAAVDAEVSLLEQTGAKDWYDWSLKNWGTKWPDHSRPPELRPRSMTMSISTAWGTPLAGLIKISEMTGLTISGRWFEAGMGYQGRFVVKAGDLLIDEAYRYRGCRGG